MDINAPPGSKVRFEHPDAGYILHQKIAAKHLTVGALYTVESTDVDAWHTDVFLREIPGVAFNSVMFEDGTPEEGDER